MKMKKELINNQNWWTKERKGLEKELKNNPNQLLAFAQHIADKTQRDKELQELLDWIDKNHNGYAGEIDYDELKDKVKELLNETK